MSYIITIPSYNRPNVLKDKTLNMLKQQGVNRAKIFIFVANKEEEAIYKSIIPKDMYNKIIVGVKGLLPQIRFICNYYPYGKEIVRIDDDIEEIFKKKHKKDENITRKVMNETIMINLNTFFKNAFKLCKKEKVHFWGINKSNNPFFMTDGYSTDLRLIVGNVNGWINTHNPDYDYKVNTPSNYVGEDIERTIRYFIIDGGVIRFNDISFIAGKYMAEGGINAEIGSEKKRLQKIKQNNKLLEKAYSKYGELVANKNQDKVFRLYRNPHSVGEGLKFDENDEEFEDPYSNN